MKFLSLGIIVPEDRPDYMIIDDCRVDGDCGYFMWTCSTKGSNDPCNHYGK